MTQQLEEIIERLHRLELTEEEEQRTDRLKQGICLDYPGAREAMPRPSP